MDKAPPAKEILTNPVHLLAFGFGAGLSTKAPGTAGTVVAIPIYLLFSQFSLTIYYILLILLIIIGIYVSGKSARMLGVHDHGGIVIDEICGYLLTMALAPTSWIAIILGFILFRLFDIWKPWPIRLFDQRIHGGTGIIVDDLMAGIYALLSLQLILSL